MALLIRQSGDQHEVYGSRTGKAYKTGSLEECKRYIQYKKSARTRRDKDDALRSLGLVKVRGALGGVYWE